VFGEVPGRKTLLTIGEQWNAEIIEEKRSSTAALFR
jgi:hypothetical protein